MQVSKACPKCGGLKKLVGTDLKTVTMCHVCAGAGQVIQEEVVEDKGISDDKKETKRSSRKTS